MVKRISHYRKLEQYAMHIMCQQIFSYREVEIIKHDLVRYPVRNGTQRDQVNSKAGTSSRNNRGDSHANAPPKAGNIHNI